LPSRGATARHPKSAPIRSTSAAAEAGSPCTTKQVYGIRFRHGGGLLE
jgi:hypothetical protein